MRATRHHNDGIQMMSSGVSDLDALLLHHPANPDRTRQQEKVENRGDRFLGRALSQGDYVKYNVPL